MDSEITRTHLNMPPFYRILSSDTTEEGKVKFQIEIKSEHPIFNGHFPGFPVVPGAMMIKIFKELICGYFGKTFMLSSSNDIKFLALIQPTEDTVLNIEIIFSQTDSQLMANIIVKNEEIVSLKMSAVFSLQNP